MSNHLISATYKRDLRTPMRKSVMALLADKASDDGSGIWASKQTIADELCCSKQAIIDTIKGFIADGLLIEAGQRRAPNGYTVEYAIVIDALEALPLVKCHADRASRSQSARLTGQPAGPVRQVDATGQPAGPKPSLTPRSKKTTSSQNKRARKRAAPSFVLPSHIPTSEWKDFEEMRRRIGKPMTDKARSLAVGRLDKLAEDGWPPGDVLNNSILNNYQGLFPPKEDRNGQRLADAGAGPKLSNRVAASLERAAELGGGERPAAFGPFG